VPSLEADGSALELFCDRVRAIDASFSVEGHRDTVVQICERLDGIPLAIELAAARMRSLSAEELLDRLRDRFRVLRGSGRGTLDRHQTLRAAVSWSYQLLSNDERILFDRVSVFAGGFELPAAEKVCGFDPLDANDVIDLVSSLVDKSMIVAERRASGMRYRLLETSPAVRGGTAGTTRRDIIGARPPRRVLRRPRVGPRLSWSAANVSSRVLNASHLSGTTCAPPTCGRSPRRTSTSPSG
jgi:predicted ATPase